MRTPKATLNPNATEAERAAYWASLSKRQRIALLRSGAMAAMPSSSERQAAVAEQKAATARAC